MPDMKVWSEYLYNVTHGRAEDNPCTAEHVWRTVYGWQRWPGDEHKSGWTREDILAVLKSAGFEKIPKRESICYWPRGLSGEGFRDPGTPISICVR